VRQTEPKNFDAVIRYIELFYVNFDEFVTPANVFCRTMRPGCKMYR
jgi:hypothetical protein